MKKLVLSTGKRDAAVSEAADNGCNLKGLLEEE